MLAPFAVPARALIVPCEASEIVPLYSAVVPLSVTDMVVTCGNGDRRHGAIGCVVDGRAAGRIREGHAWRCALLIFEVCIHAGNKSYRLQGNSAVCVVSRTRNSHRLDRGWRQPGVLYLLVAHEVTTPSSSVACALPSVV